MSLIICMQVIMATTEIPVQSPFQAVSPQHYTSFISTLIYTVKHRLSSVSQLPNQSLTLIVVLGFHSGLFTLRFDLLLFIMTLCLSSTLNTHGIFCLFLPHFNEKHSLQLSPSLPPAASLSPCSVLRVNYFNYYR